MSVAGIRASSSGTFVLRQKANIKDRAEGRVTFLKGNVAFIEKRCDPFSAGPQDQIVGLGLRNELRTGEKPAWNISGMSTGFL